jgi:hypothetical protein
MHQKLLLRTIAEEEGVENGGKMSRKSSLILLLCFVCFAGTAFGQAIGSITGLVQDASDARIPGVSITATNTATGVKAQTISNESGAYNFSNLGVGPYVLEATLPGFRTARVSNIDLSSGQTLRFNLKMEVANVNTQVEVAIDARELLTVSSSSVGEALSQAQVESLPSGRW